MAISNPSYQVTDKHGLRTRAFVRLVDALDYKASRPNEGRDYTLTIVFA